MSKDLLTNDEYANAEGFYDDSDRSGITFFRIFAYQIAQVTDKPVDGWTGPYPTQHPITKVTKDNWYHPYDRFVGRIVRVDRQKKEFKDGGKVVNWNITIIARGKKAVLRLTWCEPFLKRFLMVAPNLDFTKPICMSAWMGTKKNDTAKKQQAMSFRQGPPDVNPKDWPNVPIYWQVQDGDEEDRVLPTMGEDGSKIPRPEHDDEDDTWDFKKQEKALAKYFRENIMDNVNAIGDSLGLDSIEPFDTGFNYGANVKTENDDDELTHSGPTQPKAKAQVKSAFHDDDDDDDEVIPKRAIAVTEKPANAVAKSLSDKINGEQNQHIKKMCKEMGLSPEKVAKKLLGVDYEEASTEAGAYLIHKLKNKLKKWREENPESVAPEPEPEPVKVKVKAKVADDDDDDFNLDDDEDEKPAPAKKAKTEDEDDW